MRATLVLVGCVAGCASRAPVTASAQSSLTPSDVGLPDEPVVEATSPPQYIPKRAASGYFRHDECPPDDRGCWVEQDVTHEAITVRWRCRRSSDSIVSGRSLRRLKSNLEIGEGGIDRAVARRALVRGESGLRRCFDSDGVEQHIEFRFSIHEGRLVGLETPSECVRDVMQRIEVPREATFTPVTWRLDYTLEDPASVPPLRC